MAHPSELFLFNFTVDSLRASLFLRTGLLPECQIYVALPSQTSHIDTFYDF